MIRIPLRLRYRGKEKFIEAILNTGFESDIPLLSVPLNIARELGISLRLVREFNTIGRFRGLALISDEVVEVIVEKGGKSRSVSAYVVVVPGEVESLISYTLARSLGLVVDFLREEWWIS